MPPLNSNFCSGVQCSGCNSAATTTPRASEPPSHHRMRKPESRFGPVRRKTKGNRLGQSGLGVPPRSGKYRLEGNSAQKYRLCVWMCRLHGSRHQNVSKLQVKEQQVFQVQSMELQVLHCYISHSSVNLLYLFYISGKNFFFGYSSINSIPHKHSLSLSLQFFLSILFSLSLSLSLSLHINQFTLSFLKQQMAIIN